MDWTALGLSLRLALATVVILLPLAFLLARWLAFGRFRGRGAVLRETPATPSAVGRGYRPRLRPGHNFFRSPDEGCLAAPDRPR